jgi:hypothetical protein
MALVPLQSIAWLTSEATAITASPDWLGKRADKPVVRNNQARGGCFARSRAR